LSLIVAILEDDQAQSQLIEVWLTSAGYTCHQYSTGQSLLDAVQTITFDILLIDWELPDIKGPDVMSRIRNEMHREMPIIFITSRDSEQDIVNALNYGADDYLVKPVRQFEFLARVKANSRKKPINNNDINQDQYAPYRFNNINQQASLHGHNIELSSKEFELAYFLFCNESKLLERKLIQSNVWKQDADLNTRTVDTHISIIRKKLSISPDNGWRLKSVYGHGYRLERLG
jgi:DNA-binding response OmpR family regulator